MQPIPDPPSDQKRPFLIQPYTDRLPLPFVVDEDVPLLALTPDLYASGEPFHVPQLDMVPGMVSPLLLLQVGGVVKSRVLVLVMNNLPLL
jgi:hypothetical protein